MSQAMQTGHFARSARRGEKKKQNACKESIILGFPPNYAHKLILTDGGDVKRANEKSIILETCYLFVYQKNTDSSLNHRK